MKKFLFLFFIFLLVLLGVYLWKEHSGTSQKEFSQSSLPSAAVDAPKAKTFLPHPEDTIPGMAEREYSGSNLKLGKVLAETPDYTRYTITYTSEGLSISGILNIPKGKGPFPVLFLNHGYIDPKHYTNGQGLKREQDYFARHGYAVLHSDYRGYAFSDPDPMNDVRPRTGYVEDVLNAVSAVKKSGLPSLDGKRIGMLGHSMGGGITLNVMTTKPETAKAYVLLAPINAEYRLNFERWVIPESDFEGTAERFYERYGRPEENPDFWRDISAKNFLARVSTPVMLHQGALDKDVPVEWSRDLVKSFKDVGKEITYFEYPYEPHTFINAQSLVMERTRTFFDATLKQ